MVFEGGLPFDLCRIFRLTNSMVPRELGCCTPGAACGSSPRSSGQQLGRRGGADENVPGIVGAGQAAAEAAAWLEATTGQEPGVVHGARLRDRFERLVLDRCPGAAVNGAGKPRLWNTTNIAFPRLEAEALLLSLSERGVWASAGAACSSGSASSPLRSCWQWGSRPNGPTGRCALVCPRDNRRRSGRGRRGGGGGRPGPVRVGGGRVDQTRRDTIGPARVILMIIRGAAGLVWWLCVAGLFAWALGRVFTDRYLWSQYCFWLPSVVVVPGCGGGARDIVGGTVVERASGAAKSAQRGRRSR